MDDEAKQTSDITALANAPRRISALSWKDNAVVYLDVRAIPTIVYRRASSLDDITAAIVHERVAGTVRRDLIGAYGLAFARRDGATGDIFRTILERIRTLCGRTTVHSAIDRVAGATAAHALDEAHACLAEQARTDDAIARNASPLLDGRSAILSDGLSGPFFHGERRATVFLRESQAPDDTATFSAFALQHAGIAATIFPDRAAAWLLQSAGIDAVIVGAQAIGADADAVCAIGTYGIALAAAHHGIPCYLAASRSIVDCTLRLTQLQTIAAGGVDIGNGIFPRWDVTPGRFFSAIVTEYGITRPPYDESLLDLLSRPDYSLLSNDRARDEPIG